MVWAGYASFFLVGWCMLLAPSLIRDIEAEYSKSDAAMGLAYLLFSLAWVSGTISSGVLAAHLPRRLLMGGSPVLIALGLAVMAAAGAWGVFLAGFLVFGFGLGIIDSGMNAVFMDLFPTRQAAALNRLHLWVAVGALAGPVTIGRMVGAGVPWQSVVAATAAGAAIIAVALLSRRLPPTQHGPVESATGTQRAAVSFPAKRHVPLPVLLLSIAIGCYVATEMGVTGWLVRYLDDVPIEVATLALSLFWGGVAVGRLLTSYLADRFGAVVLAATWSVVFGVAILASLVAPTVWIAIACFAIAGLAAGPVYPMIMAIGGSLYPDRTSMVSSVLASAAIVGSIVYPPLMGPLSETAGLAVGILGAALFSFAAAALIFMAARMARAGRSVTLAGTRASHG